MRTSMKRINYQIDSLNKRLQLPATGYTRSADGKLIANIGNLYIDSNSPGDGVTRYRLAQMSNEAGGIRTLRSLACLGKSEFDTYLDGVHTGIDLARQQHKALMQRAASLIAKGIAGKAYGGISLPHEASHVLEQLERIIEATF